MKEKIAPEVAETEFNRMCEAFRIDPDPKPRRKQTPDEFKVELAEWNELRDDIIRDMCEGTTIVGTDGRPTYTPPVTGAKSITLSSPTGATLIAAKGKENDISSMSVAMADMSGLDVNTFGKLDRLDFYAVGRLVRLFLADRR